MLTATPLCRPVPLTETGLAIVVSNRNGILTSSLLHKTFQSITFATALLLSNLRPLECGKNATPGTRTRSVTATIHRGTIVASWRAHGSS